MPLDPSISLGVKVPETNILGTIGQFAQIQNWLNTSRMFQQTFAARQAAGQIIAGSDPNDLEGMIKNLQANPQVSAYYPEIMSNIRQQQMTIQEMQGKQFGQSNTMLQAFAKSLGPAYNNPQMLPGLVKAQLDLMPSGTASVQAKGAMNDVITSLIGDLPQGSDPQSKATATKMWQSRMAGLLTSGGLDASSLTSLTGSPQIVDQGGKKTPGIQLPASLGGGFAAGGGALPMSLPPTVIDTGDSKVITGAGGGTLPLGLSPQLGETPSGARIPVGGKYGLGMSEPAPSSLAVASPGGAAATASAQLAADGTPLYPPELKPAAGGPVGIGGVPGVDRTRLETDRDKALNDQYSEKGVPAYNGAMNMKASLSNMNSAFDQLVQSGTLKNSDGSFLVPGAGADLRTELANLVNTGASMAGIKPPIDPQNLSSAQLLQKEASKLTLLVTNQFLGAQREAAQNIQRVAQTVPGMSNSYMGAKLLMSSLNAAADSQIDYHNFITQWSADHAGSLFGAEVAFNKLHPPQSYAEKALEPFGLTQNGFKDVDSLKRAVSLGYVTPKQAEVIAEHQWPTAPATPSGQQ